MVVDKHDAQTAGDPRVLAAMLLFWGIAATVGNLLSGQLVDRFESRKIINAALCVAIINFCLLPWSSAHTVSAAIAMVIWGLCGWGLIVPQQHRLLKISPPDAPLLLALNNTATYGGLACSGVIGGFVLVLMDRHYLSLVGAGFIAIALVFAELAHLCIVRRHARDHAMTRWTEATSGCV